MGKGGLDLFYFFSDALQCIRRGKGSLDLIYAFFSID